jgi:hypothetical protein
MIVFEQSGKVEEFKDKIDLIINKKEYTSILILACEANEYVSDEINAIIRELEIPIFGGIFPSIIYKKVAYNKGSILVGIKNEINIHLLVNIDNENNNFEKKLSENIENSSNKKTLFVFVDAFSSRITELIESLFNVFGLGYNYLGGGAGSLANMTSTPCIFTPKGLLTQAAIIVAIDIDSSIGVKHGWEKIGNPMRVTSSHNQTIKTLDWANAFDVYKEAILAHSGEKIIKDNFFDIAKTYPFGIIKIESEYIIRDPFEVTEKGELNCFGNVPENSFVYIMHGERQNLIDAAKEAKLVAKMDTEVATSYNTVIFIDCITRSIFLGNKFENELEAVYDPNYHLIGMLSIGEIANNGKYFLEFYNKTSVIGLIKL